MTSIIEFPDEPKFSIKTVCSQTGIRAVTLRAWERRHEVLTPFRSENRYRLYSERDVAILRWIKSRVDSGVSISRAVEELRSMRKNGIWPDALPTMPAPTRSVIPALPTGTYSRQLYQALIHHDEISAGKIIQEIQMAYDIRTICMDIFTPCLVDIGEAWYRGEIRVTTEHFASAYLRGKLLSLLQAYSNRRNAPYILIGCAPTEQHEIGSLMVAVLLRSHGFRVEYLGPDVPIEDLVDYASYEHPQMVILTASMESTALELVHAEEKVGKLHPIPIFGYGGGAFVRKVDLRKKIPGIYLGDDLDDAVETVERLFEHYSTTHERTGRVHA